MEQVSAEEQVELILADQREREADRGQHESTWREVDRYVDPHSAGGWDRTTVSFAAGDDLFDVTACDGLDRHTSAIGGLTIPRNQRWHGVHFANKDLMKLDRVIAWCEVAQDALFTYRYRPLAGFESQMFEDIRQEGKYGSSALWVDEHKGLGIYYKSIHLSEIYIRENHFGGVDSIHRRFEYTIRQAIGHFGYEALSAATQERAKDPRQLNHKLWFLHVVCPNKAYEPGRLGAKGKPIASTYIEEAQKHEIRKAGYYTNPLLVSRHSTGPNDVYGRSPAIKALPAIRGVNTMQRIVLDAGNRALDPPLLFNDDADLTTMQTFPGGLIPGGVDSEGRPTLIPLQSGAQIPVGMEMVDQERNVIKRIFLEEFFRLLSDPSDRMTATQVVEQLQKEGILVAPYAGRRETEKLSPMIDREIDILTRLGKIPPLPDEVREAGEKPLALMTNPLSRMARAEEVSAFSRVTEMAVGIASAGRPEALDVINFEAGLRDTATILGARPSHINTPDQVAATRAARAEEKAGMEMAAVVPDAARASLDLAKAGEIQARLDGGGGL